jgi:hypothetical protein
LRRTGCGGQLAFGFSLVRRTLYGALAAFFLVWLVYFLMIAVFILLGGVPYSVFVLWVNDLPIPTATSFWLDLGLKWLKGAALASAALSFVMVSNALWIEKKTPTEG